MAMDLPRSSADDVADALARLDDAERELANWRAHLRRAARGANPGVLDQARRSARIVGACIDGARDLTADARYRAADEADDAPADAASARAFATTSLRSVS
jgi:hypothetical protein